jgi:polyhydroxybutyrate depolymerase
VATNESSDLAAKHPPGSVSTSRQGWADHDHCASTPTSTNIGTDVVKFGYAGCAWSSSTAHYRVIGSGHTWPGATVHNGPGTTTLSISATAVIWRFFLSHPLG